MSETPLLQDRWHVLRVDELGNVSTGGTPPTSEASNYGGDIPFIGPADLGEHRWINSHSTTLSSSGASRVRLAQAGDVIVSCIGILGKVGQVTETSGFNQQLNCISANAKVDQDFLYYACSSLGPALSRAAGLQVVPIVKKSLFSSLKIAVPRAKREQQRIATILSTIDTAIEQTEALIEKYQHIKAGLMHDLFTRGVLPTGQLRPPREQSPELYQETAIGWIPREWLVQSFGSNVLIVDPNPSHRYPDEVTEGVPICSTENFDGVDKFDLSRGSFVSLTSFENQNIRCQFQKNDVVFARKGRIGLARRYGEAKKAFSHTVVIFKPKTNDVDAPWLLWAARSFWFLGGIDRTMNSNSGVPTLGIDFISKVKIPFPDKYEQSIVAQKLDGVSRELNSQIAVLGKLKAQKIGLMQDLLTGKVSVTPVAAQGVATP